MTFKEAVKFKKSLPSDKIDRGKITMELYVVPSENRYFYVYMAHVHSFFNYLEDEDAITFSSNKQFHVRGICLDGKSILCSDPIDI